MTYQEMAQIFMMVAVTGLGLKELIAAVVGWWQKRQEKLLDHDLSQEDKNAEFLRAQVLEWQNRVKEIEDTKFKQMGENIAQLMVHYEPCQDLMAELLANRDANAKRFAQIDTKLDAMATERKDITEQLLTQNEAVKAISKAIGVGTSKPNRYGRVVNQLDFAHDDSESQ